MRSPLAWPLSVMPPPPWGVYPYAERSQRQPGVGDGSSDGPAAIAVLWEHFLRDGGLYRCTPAVEVPTYTDGRGCVGVIDHVL